MGGQPPREAEVAADRLAQPLTRSAAVSGKAIELVMVPSSLWRAYSGVTRSWPCSSTGPISRSIQAGLTERRPASSTAQPRAPTAVASSKMA